mgnify:CR=1 FL=1
MFILEGSGSIIDEVLKYMDVQTDYTVEQAQKNVIVIPNVVGMTFAQARDTLGASGFSISPSADFADDTVITNQVPKSGAALEAGSIVAVYKEGDEVQKVEVPDVRSYGYIDAKDIFNAAGLNVRIEGTGYVLTQDVTPFEQIDKGSIVTLKCVDDINELP